MSRDNRQLIAKKTLAIVKQGNYTNDQDKSIDISEWIKKSVQNTKLYLPEEIDSLVSQSHEARFDTSISIENETSLQAAYNLRQEVGEQDKILCLNFASAKNPGGGFLGGSQAQEESLARSSGLYESLQTQPKFYEFHRKQKNLLYSDHMIYSPDVPVFRNDEGDLLDRPYALSFITSPAPNRGAIAKNTPDLLPEVKETFVKRGAGVLALAASQGYQILILGAWGCGVFQNEPEEIAYVFSNLLNNDFKDVFKKVHFAVLDRSKETNIYNSFKAALA